MSHFRGAIAEKFSQSYTDYLKWDIEAFEQGMLQIWPAEKIVYLSGDAEETLESVEDDKVYVIGGLVDRNRHKVKHTALCYQHYASM